jgi:hypothetical protein
MGTALVGTVLQLLLSVARHFVAGISPTFALFGHMMLSATAGYLYGLIFAGGYGKGALGGAIAGGLCVVPAFASSILLGDSDGLRMLTAVLIAILSGVVGGIFGQMGAILRKLGL